MIRPDDSIETAAQAAYIVAALLFILALAGLSHHETAQAWATPSASPAWPSRWSRRSRWPSTATSTGSAVALLVAAMAIGAAIGLWRARVVEMTGMPELIALLHSFVGLAAVLVGWNGYLDVEDDPDGHRGRPAGRCRTCSASTTPRSFIGVFIGAVTFTGSIVAFLKLSARIKSNPLMLPGKNVLNLGALAAFARADRVVRDRPAAVAADRGHRSSRWPSGWHLVASIGGGDMPVVVSMLNSYSGLGRGRLRASCSRTTC